MEVYTSLAAQAVLVFALVFLGMTALLGVAHLLVLLVLGR